MTCKFRIYGLQDFVKTATSEPCILMLWHNRLLIIGYVLSKFTKNLRYAAFVSNSKDGRILAAFVDSYRRGRALRVSHNARGQALKSLINDLKKREEVILITPDGPRGPKYEIKPGVIKAAAATSALTIPFSWSASSFWQLNTWDNLIIPKPFSTIVVQFGENLPSDSSFKEALDHATQKANQAFERRPV